MGVEENEYADQLAKADRETIFLWNSTELVDAYGVIKNWIKKASPHQPLIKLLESRFNLHHYHKTEKKHTSGMKIQPDGQKLYPRDWWNTIFPNLLGGMEYILVTVILMIIPLVYSWKIVFRTMDGNFRGGDTFSHHCDLKAA